MLIWNIQTVIVAYHWLRQPKGDGKNAWKEAIMALNKVNQSVNQSIDPSINKNSLRQSINRSVEHKRVKQSSNQSMIKLNNHAFPLQYVAPRILYPSVLVPWKRSSSTLPRTKVCKSHKKKKFSRKTTKKYNALPWTYPNGQGSLHGRQQKHIRQPGLDDIPELNLSSGLHLHLFAVQ